MIIGHLISLIGAVLVCIGAAVLDWQEFVLAGVATKGFLVAPAGQIVLGLGGLIALTSLAGAFTRRRKQFATASVIVASFLIAWVVLANVTKASAFALMPHETVNLLDGYTVAFWGAIVAFIGPLVVFASEPRLSPKDNFLRVALIWNKTVLEERLLTEGETFTVGESARNNFVVPADKLPAKFPLFRAGRKRGSYSIGLSADLDGEVTINGDTRPIAAFAGSADNTVGGVPYKKIMPGDWGTVQLGELAVFFQYVQPEPRSSRKGLLVFDEYVLSAVSISMIIQVGFLLTSIFTWKVDPTRIPTPQEEKEFAAEIQVRQLDKEQEVPLEEGEEEDTTAKQAEGEEGKFGDPEEDPDKETIVPKRDGKFVDKIDPRKVGVLDVMAKNKKQIAGIISDAAAMQNQIAVAMSGEGNTLQVGFGSGGLGFKGTGTGGGGDAGVGRIQGMGKIDTGGGMAAKAGLGAKKKRRVGKVNIRSGSATGFCKKGDIARVVRRRAAAIRSCYERRLQVKPKLSGKLSARWTIKADGSVGGASAGGSMSDSNVTNCVLRVIRRMRFRKPEGGVCIVRWPFVFSGGG